MIDVCLFYVTLLSNITLAHGWYCHWYRCLEHQPVAFEVRHRGETYRTRCNNGKQVNLTGTLRVNWWAKVSWADTELKVNSQEKHHSPRRFFMFKGDSNFLFRLAVPHEIRKQCRAFPKTTKIYNRIEIIFKYCCMFTHRLITSIHK